MEPADHIHQVLLFWVRPSTPSRLF
jgi:hypothetical protein